MKNLVAFLLIVTCLSGCGIQDTMETISDSLEISVIAPVKQLEITLPAEASSPTLLAEDGAKLYECDGYTLCVQTLAGGDLNRTLREITGFDREVLTVMETEKDGYTQYNSVWSATGENGDYVGRVLILDDSNYHYTVSVMAEFSKAGELSDEWQDLLKSVAIKDTD